MKLLTIEKNSRACSISKHPLDLKIEKVLDMVEIENLLRDHSDRNTYWAGVRLQKLSGTLKLQDVK